MDANLEKTIFRNLNGLQINESARLGFLRSYTFPDDFEMLSRSYRPIFGLFYEGKLVGMISFDIAVNGLHINYIQGIRGVQPPRNWVELILMPVVFEALKNYYHLGSNAITLEPIKELNRGLDIQTNQVTTSVFKTHLDKIKESMHVYGKARDLFFDKDGNLNFNKDRSKRLVELVNREFMHVASRTRIQRFIDKFKPRRKFNLK